MTYIAWLASIEIFSNPNSPYGAVVISPKAAGCALCEMNLRYPVSPLCDIA